MKKKEAKVSPPKTREESLSKKQKMQRERKTNLKVPPKPVKKRKIQYGKIAIVFCFFLGIFLLGFSLLQVPIQSILIEGNTYLSDQEIIDLAGIREYPSTFKNSSKAMEKKLEQNDFILSAKVEKKNWYRTVKITVLENRPLFYYQPRNKMILQDGTAVEGNQNLPIVLNQIPEDVYQKFLEKMKDVPEDVLIRMSEIRYYPNDVDPELFYISMNDGNYVYVNIVNFKRLYNYLNYVEGSNNKRGILHLDSGDYLEVLEEIS